jgi:MFS family permease
MGLLRTFSPERGLSVMGAWAAANGVGQAIGPATGGLISDALGWRMIFVALGAACLVVLALTWIFVPSVPHRSGPFDVRGAVLLTGGVGLALVAATTFSQRAGSHAGAIAEAVAGVCLLFAYVAVSRRRSGAMIPLDVLAESRFLRSAAAAFGQMFCLGTVLVAFPLFFTGPLHMSNGLTGILLFTLPTVMAIAAPLVSRLSLAVGPRRVLRSGLAVLIAGSALISVLVTLVTTSAVAVALTAMLLVLGVGMAMVQTPAAAGATSSPAGAYGAAVGLFNMVRFSGTAIAAAWVALVYPTGSMLLLFGGCAFLAALALAASYLGPAPGTGMSLPVSRIADPGSRAARFRQGR